MRLYVASMCVVWSSLTLGAEAQPTTRPVVVDLSTPQAAHRTFVQAMVQGDTAAYRAASSASTAEQKQFLNVYVNLMLAQNRLLTALSARFGREAADSWRSPYVDPRREGLSQSKDLSDVRYAIQGDRATADGSSGTVNLLRVQREWRVRLPQPDPSGTDWTKMCELLAAYHNDLAANVEAGKYGTVSEFQKAARQKLEQPVEPTSRPSR